MNATLDKTLRAVSDDTRRGIIELLETEPLRAGDIADHFPGLSRPAISRHLRVLRSVGLVTEADSPLADHDAREVWYRADPGPLRSLGLWISRYRRYWENRLDELADIVERRK